MALIQTPLRREHRRIECAVPVRILVGGRTITAESRNVSAGGMLIATSERLVIGAAVEVAFHLPALPKETQTGAIVRWLAPGVVGVQFLQLRAVEVWALHRLADEMR